VVVTTSMIEAAARSLLEESGGSITVLRLQPPGSCPGHFDLAGGDLARLKSAARVLRHDYQGVLDGKLAGMAGGGVCTVALATPGSLLIPRHFLALAEDVQAQLADVQPARAAEVRSCLDRLRSQLTTLEQQARAKAAEWVDWPVVASSQQREFCQWLDLRVVGELPRAEDLSPRQLAVLQRSGAKAVVGNLQSDSRAAAVLAERLGVPLAVLSNFPGAEGYGETYADLVRRNLEELSRVCQRRSPN